MCGWPCTCSGRPAQLPARTFFRLPFKGDSSKEGWLESPVHICRRHELSTGIYFFVLKFMKINEERSAEIALLLALGASRFRGWVHCFKWVRVNILIFSRCSSFIIGFFFRNKCKTINICHHCRPVVYLLQDKVFEGIGYIPYPTSYR